MSNAYLMEKVGYMSRQPTQINSEIAQNTLTVKSTFVYDPDSKTAPDTAKQWAERSHWGGENKKPLGPVIKNNDPFTIQIISLESRAEGGRAYKVIDDQGYMFDLREDQVVESLTYGGIQKGGKINGEFVWGKNHSQMKLVYVGGKVHQEMILGLQERKQKKRKIKPKSPYTLSKLIPGHVYSRKRNVQYQDYLDLYIGKFKMPHIKGTCVATYKIYKYYQSNISTMQDIQKLLKEDIQQQFGQYCGKGYWFGIGKSVKPYDVDHGSVSEEWIKNFRKGTPGYNGWSNFYYDCEAYYEKNVQAKPKLEKPTTMGFFTYGLLGSETYLEAQKKFKENQNKLKNWEKDFEKWLKEQIEWID